MRSSRSSSAKHTCIQRLHIDDLFGYLTYTVPHRKSSHADFNRLIILYGDNGAGKTTILRLIFSILSPHRNRGDKTFVYRTPFRAIEINFDNGLTVRAYRTGTALLGDYSIGIRPRFADEQTFPITADADALAVKDTPEVVALLAALGNLGIALYFLPDDRRVRSTYPPELDIEHIVEETAADTTRRLFRFYTSRNNLSLPREREESHYLNIEPILSEVNSW